ncbi:cytochrome P450 [Nonomuraea sp. NPDC050536]|uniref:cytochrome P450 family protein n=1 Tax=Nonomuraea sp. NPDC050536 TaxID=3364366 RepID=UPI0037C8B77A
MTGVPEIDLTDVAVIRDPFGTYGAAREQAPVARLLIPGMAPMWVVTRHAEAREMLGDPRFEINAGSFMRPDVPDDCLPYMSTMSEMNGQEHARLRRLVAPAFTPRRANDFRPRIQARVDHLLDTLQATAGEAPRYVTAEEALPGTGTRESSAQDARADTQPAPRQQAGAPQVGSPQAESAREGSPRVESPGVEVVDLLTGFARALPMDVICELVGIPDEDRPRWREYGATVAMGMGEAFAKAIPRVMEGAKAAVARRREEPGDDLVTDLVQAVDDGDRLSETELVTMIWQLVLSGQTPTNLIANSIATLLTHPDQLQALRADPAKMPMAVEELIRWCGPTLLSIPRYAREDLDLYGVQVRKGEAVCVSVAAANRDPRAFPDPDRFDIANGRQNHLGFSFGPHFCVGASVARVETEVALTSLLRSFPDLALAAEVDEIRAPDPGTWRLTSLPVTLR